MNSWDSPVALKRCCLNLRHKQMYVDSRQSCPGLVNADSDTRVYLCVLSQEVLGPDDKPVSPADCCPSRACYRAGAQEA